MPPPMTAIFKGVPGAAGVRNRTSNRTRRHVRGAWMAIGGSRAGTCRRAVMPPEFFKERKRASVSDALPSLTSISLQFNLIGDGGCAAVFGGAGAREELKAACERNEHFPSKMTTSKERRPNQ